MRKLGIILSLLVVNAPAFASCRDLVEQQNDALVLASKSFPSDTSMFTVVTCKTRSPVLFEILYTQLHERDKHLHNAPSGGLSKLKFPVDPNGRTRSTGIVLAEKDEAGGYTLKLRTRTASGDAMDISKTVPLASGQSTVFEDQGVTIGFARLHSK